MSGLGRSAAALLVLALLVAVGLAGAEWFVRSQVEAVVTDVVGDQMRQAGDGAGFAAVDTSLQGLALRGLVDGRFDGVTVGATDGVVHGVPVQSIDVVADGVATDGRAVDALSATVRADAAALVATGLDPAVAAAVVASAVALPPDRVRVSTPFEVPGLGVVPVEVEMLFRAVDGGVVVEPVAARVAGQDVDLAQLSVLPSRSVAADQLPAGLRVDAVEVVEVAGRPVLEADLSCPAGCSLR